MASILAIIVYAAFMAGRIGEHTAVPYFDQAGYVLKVHALADLVSGRRGLLAMADLPEVLATPPANRGTLMPLAAALALGKGDFRDIALLWLGIRLLALLVALAVLARAAGTAAFLPATVCVILAGHTQLMLNPSLYMMDQTFECFGLLAFALALLDVQRRSARSAAQAGAAAVALALVKPAAIAFIFPLYAVVMATAFRVGARAVRARWVLPHAIAWLALLLLALSPYGAAVRGQYQLGSLGYWSRGYTPTELVIWAVLVLPTWLAALAALALVRHGRRALPPALLPAAGLTAAWWYGFNTMLTYTIDARVIAAATPVAVSAAAIVICRGRGLRLAATATAVAAFGLALACASGRVPFPNRLLFVSVMPRAQHPVAEVGLVPLMERTAQEAGRAEPTRGPVPVMALISDDFVDPGALSLALLKAPAEHRARVQVLPAPWGSDPAELDRATQVRWFLTKKRRKTVPLAGEVWTLVHALDALITDTASPLHLHFERRLSQGVRQPDLADEVELWRVRKPPTAARFLAALRWLEPRFRSTRGHAGLLQRIASTTEALARLPTQPGGALQLHIDGIERLGAVTRVDGWAFDAAGSHGSQVFLVLQAPSRDPEVFSAARVRRPDVSAHFGRPDLDDAGFSALLPHEGLSSGDYRLGLYVARPGEGALSFTGRSLLVD